MNIKQTIFLPFALILLFVFNDSAMANKTCCMRDIASMPVSGADESQSVILIGLWQEVLIPNAIDSECPHIDFYDMKRMGQLNMPKEYLDYVFKSNFSDNKQRGVCTLNLELYDHHHGKVVKQAQAIWKYEEVAGSKFRRAVQPIHEMARQFMPLSKTLSDYERAPESCSVDPEKDPVEPDETITVNISGIKDSEGRTSADFQWILVKAKKGEIVNGEEWNDYKGFKVGGGSVNVKYKAPSCCKKEEETVIVYNSCWQKPEHPGLPENKIGKATFSKAPEVIKASIEYDHELTHLFPCDGCYRVTRVTGKVPITIYLDEKPPRIRGGGKVKSKLYGEGDGCNVTASGTMSVSISGTVRKSNDDEQLLLVRFSENHPDNWTVNMVCPEKPDDSGHYPEPMDPPPRIKDDVWIFKLEDGFRLHLQGNFSGKGWNNILHVPCLRSCSK